MAAKAKKSTPSSSKASNAATTVTRIKATETKPSKKAPSKAATAKAAASTAPQRPATAYFKPFIAIGTYFKGAWYELRQVRWPNRKATWGLTAAVLIFSAFFVVLIVLLDIVFKYLFELILK